MAEDTRNRPDYSGDAYSKPAREQASDPLAELARLIGQSDPFTDAGPRAARKPLDTMKTADRPAPEWLARPAAPEADDHDDASALAPHADARYGAGLAEQPSPEYDPGEYDEPEPELPLAHVAQPAGPPRYAAHEAAVAAQPAYAAYSEPHDDAEPQADEYADDRYRVARPGAAEYEDGYYDGHIPPGEEGALTPRKRGGLITIAAIVGLAIIGTAGAFGYRAYTSGPSAPSEPPVIKADPTPPKTVPPAPAPAVDAQGKPFQDRVGAVAPDKVVPREEQPVAVPVAPPRSMSPAPAAAAPAPLVAPPPGNVNEPKRVRTMTIRADTPDGTPTASVTPPAPAQNAGAAKQPPAKQSGPMSIGPQSEPSARTKVAARTPPAQAAGGAYVVQVSAQRTEAEAQSSYRALQQKYPAVLGSREANVRRVDLGDKGGVFYRAQVGSFASSEQATQFCDSLKSAGGQCIVQKN